jgi:hypothetical protein
VQSGQLDATRPLRESRLGPAKLRRDACLHLTCTNVERASLDQTLDVSTSCRAYLILSDHEQFNRKH